MFYNSEIEEWGKVVRRKRKLVATKRGKENRSVFSRLLEFPYQFEVSQIRGDPGLL